MKRELKLHIKWESDVKYESIIWEPVKEQTSTGQNYRHYLVKQSSKVFWGERPKGIAKENGPDWMNCQPTAVLLSRLWHPSDRAKLTAAALQGNQSAQEFLRLVQSLQS